jgi:curved DNA-binding protein CbpA
MNGTTGFSTNFILDALQRIHREKLTGVLSFPYEDDLANFEFQEGEFITFDSQTGRKYLLPFLEAKGVPAGALLAGTTGTVELANLQAIQPAVLEFVGQVFNRLADPAVGVLLNFQPKEVETIRVGSGIPASSLVLQFFDNWLEARLLPALQPDPAAVIRVSPGHLQRVRDLALTPRQGFILARLQDGLSVRDFLLSCGMPEEQVLRDILAFSYLDILNVGTPARAAGPPESTHRAATPPPPSSRTSRPAPTPRPAAKAQKVEVISPDLLSQVEDLAIVVERGNWYEVLDVSVLAETEEIKHQFVDLTKRFHPDKFQQYGDPILQAKVDAIFTKITEAYEVLKDPLRRSAYNEQTGMDKAPLQKTAPPPAAGDKHGSKDQKVYAYEDQEHKAKQYFLHGKEALKNQKFHDAVENFRQAVRMMPDVCEYQFFLGRTLAMNPQRAKEAEERLKRALELLPDRVEILLELGRFYDRLNLRLRAKTFYERVLKLDPKNGEAMHALGIKPKKELNFKNLFKMDLKDLLKSKKDQE